MLLFIFVSFNLFSQSTENNLETVETYIYPNPSALGKFMVVSEPNSIFSLYSTSGTYIGKWEFGNSKELEVIGIPQGFYQAIIESNGRTIFKKIVIL